MNRHQLDQLRSAIRTLQEAEAPAGQADAQELLFEIHHAFKDLEQPLVELIEKGKINHPDGDSDELPTIVRSQLRKLQEAILHALGED
jgi:hypothetical protein